MAPPSYFSWFDQTNNIFWSVQIIIKLLVMVSSLPCCFSPWGQPILLSTLNLQHPQPMLPPQFVTLKNFITLRSTGMGRSVVSKEPCVLSLFLWEATYSS
jgi:hypothetical protein